MCAFSRVLRNQSLDNLVISFKHWVTRPQGLAVSKLALVALRTM